MSNFFVLISVVLVFTSVRALRGRTNIKTNENSNNESTDLASEKDARLLVFATLDGSLVALKQQTGQLQWTIKDKPVVKVPLDTTNAIIPTFLPDPKDGSLYHLGESAEPLRKLPFTIPELVAASPCRSSNGILYTGKKKDIWFALNPRTGERQPVLGWETTSETCPIDSADAVYLGRTKYSVMMVDINNPLKRWNVTFYDYAATPMTKEQLNNYDLVHFTSSSSGRLLTMDRRRGSLLWDTDLGSPVVAAYILDPDGLLIVPFSTMANHTLSHLALHFSEHQQPFQNEPSHMKLYPTLYVGHHVYGLYALSSLVDENVVSITPSESGPLMLSGPGVPDVPRPHPEYPIPGHNYQVPPDFHKFDPLTFQSVQIILGHYNVPEYTDNKFLINGKDYPTKLLTDASEENVSENTKNSIGSQTNLDDDELTENLQESLQWDGLGKVITHFIENAKTYLNQQENKGLKFLLLILIGCVIAMFWYLQMQVREFQQLSQNGSKSSQQSSMSKGSSASMQIEELPDGLMRVGKITFNPEHLLGKGCEGTFVYRGEFDARKVAVKRLLPECFTFADREVALLRESDTHPNVVRYYCTEQDRMFRYIALELCQATLSDYVQGTCDTSLIEPLEALRQATAGLAHLHALGIVHRDIKPHNVLLSMPDNRGQVHAMISDFGLCKKLQLGRVSFSRRSGVTGTDGWIAPEMIDGGERITCAVDLFSLGCLFYYVLSEGSHPFGEALRRQANILSGEWTLKHLRGGEERVVAQKLLVAAMISSSASDRPPCTAILAFPVFWEKAKMLAFLQDVSDRVEKVDLDDPVLQALERNGSAVVRGNWQVHIDDEVASDLKKYRSYRGDSVRDLLRALRNKKHHIRELSPEAQKALGDVPNSFTDYWVGRFPLLLIHSWLAMQCVSQESAFACYYPKGYEFVCKLEGFYERREIPVDDVGFASQMPRKRAKMKLKARNVVENVGLYRNLRSGVNFEDDERFVRRGNANVKGKGKEEPLIWAVAARKE